MYNYTLPVSNKAIVDIAKSAFDLVDPRLIGHGSRVSYIVFKMLEADNSFPPLKIRNFLILSALHDIGAYKTDEIDKMVEFETRNIWNHSIYGYLFFRYFSPFKDMASVILFHHAPWTTLAKFEDVSDEIKKLSQILNLADRFDIYFTERDNLPLEDFKSYLERQKNKLFCPEVIELFYNADLSFLPHITTGHAKEFELSEEMSRQFEQMLEQLPFSNEERDSILKMLTYAIDFRSPHTVTHTITTTVISSELAAIMFQDQETINDTICGAMLHDLGKIGIPVEILEFPGKLSPQAMNVMKTHVDLTACILGDSISPVVRDIALRHHEKLDGTGYPRGLSANDLTMPQRIVAVADIVSALTGTRSYKASFPKEKTVSIIMELADNGKIDKKIVSLIVDNFDTIMASVHERSTPTLEIYQEMQNRYLELLNHLMNFI